MAVVEKPQTARGLPGLHGRARGARLGWTRPLHAGIAEHPGSCSGDMPVADRHSFGHPRKPSWNLPEPESGRRRTRLGLTHWGVAARPEVHTRNWGRAMAGRRTSAGPGPGVLPRSSIHASR